MKVQRYASVTRLTPEHETEYLRLHAAVWPGVLEQIRRSGITNYSIWLRDGMLFSYYEYVGDDHARDLATMSADPETQAWWKLTDPCQQPVASATDEQRWAPMTEVFYTA